MDAPEVVVEVHLANGLPSFTIVDLPEAEIKESKDRILKVASPLPIWRAPRKSNQCILPRPCNIDATSQATTFKTRLK
jgi:hypothetical protein